MICDRKEVRLVGKVLILIDKIIEVGGVHQCCGSDGVAHEVRIVVKCEGTGFERQLRMLAGRWSRWQPRRRPWRPRNRDHWTVLTYESMRVEGILSTRKSDVESDS